MLFLPILLGLCIPPAHPVTRPVDLGEGATIQERFKPPVGFRRGPAPEGSFASWLRLLPVLPSGSPVMLYNGVPKARQDLHAAVLDLSIGSKDLQQCADAIMRLRAEYLFAQGRSNEIHFNFTNGFRADFSRWANGERIQVQGHTCQWKGEGPAKKDHATLMSFLQQVFTYGGTLSLSKELKEATLSRLEPGDVFIQGGSPGHAMLVMDVAEHPDGRMAFLMAQSYMPAQSIHLVKDLRHPELGAWYILEGDDRLYTPEWTFDWSDRRSWP